MGDTCEMLRHVLDVLAAFGEGLLAQLLKALLTDPLLATTAKLLAQAEPRTLPKAEGSARGGQRLPKAEGSAASRALWLVYHREAWRAGAPYTREELRRDAHLTAKAPLSRPEVFRARLRRPLVTESPRRPEMARE